MIVGVGIDLTDIERVTAVYKCHQDHFLNRYFSRREIDILKKRRDNFEFGLAGKFAAKEAVIKALGNITDITVHLRDIEILKLPNGCPYAVLSNRLNDIIGGYRIDISISHEKKLAIAMAVISKEA